MPSPRSSLRSRRGWTDEHRAALIGHDWFHAFRHAGDTDAGEDENRRQAWAELGEGLTFDFAKDKPFSRPPSWWDFDAPERRRCINGIHPHDRPATCEWLDRLEVEYPGHRERFTKLWYGVPSCMGGPDCDWKNYPLYESEKAYLVRLDLLLPFERELLAKESQPASAALADVETL